MSLAILFHFLCTQHVSDINISIIRSLRLFCWITTLVVLFLVRCVPHQISITQRTENKTTDVVIQQHSRKLLMMDILMSETCWAHKKWNKTASDIKLVFHSSTRLACWFIYLSYNDCAALQIGRSLVRFQMVSLEFFIDIIFPIALWPWGRLSL